MLQGGPPNAELHHTAEDTARTKDFTMRLLQIRHLGSLDPDSVPSHRSAARAGALRFLVCTGGCSSPSLQEGCKQMPTYPTGWWSLQQKTQRQIICLRRGRESMKSFYNSE